MLRLFIEFFLLDILSNFRLGQFFSLSRLAKFRVTKYVTNERGGKTLTRCDWSNTQISRRNLKFSKSRGSERMINFDQIIGSIIGSKKRKRSKSRNSSDGESKKRRRKLFCLPPGSPDLKPELKPVDKKIEDDQISLLSFQPGNAPNLIRDPGNGLKFQPYDIF